MSSVELRRQNMRMLQKLREHRAIDVSECPRTTTGDYLLSRFKEGSDYCVAETSEWIWSIGRVTRPLPSVMADGRPRVLMPGEFLASTSTKFYTPGLTDPTECVFLR
jgi:hypothetical protein